MIPDADTLPTDPDALRDLLLAERARHAEAIARIEQERDAAVGIDLQVYLADILARIANGHPINRLDQLLPWN